MAAYSAGAAFRQNKQNACIESKGLNLSGEALFGIPFPDKDVSTVAHGVRGSQVSKISSVVSNRICGEEFGIRRPLPSIADRMSDGNDYGDDGPNV